MSASLRKGGQDSNRAFSDPSRESHSLVPSCSALHDGFPTIDEICVLLKCLKQIEPTLACFESDLAINTRSFLRWTVGDYQLRPFDIDTSRDECRWRSSPITSRQIKHDEKLLVDRRVIPDPGVGLFVTVV